MLEPEHARNAWPVIMLITRQTSYNWLFQVQLVAACSSHELVLRFTRDSNWYRSHLAKWDSLTVNSPNMSLNYWAYNLWPLFDDKPLNVTPRSRLHSLLLKLAILKHFHFVYLCCVCLCCGIAFEWHFAWRS